MYDYTVWYVMVRYSLEQRVFMYDTYVKYGPVRKCRRKFRLNFVMKESPAEKQFTVL
jgi:hypothetical protein